MSLFLFHLLFFLWLALVMWKAPILPKTLSSNSFLKSFQASAIINYDLWCFVLIYSLFFHFSSLAENPWLVHFKLVKGELLSVSNSKASSFCWYWSHVAFTGENVSSWTVIDNNFPQSQQASTHHSTYRYRQIYFTSSEFSCRRIWQVSNILHLLWVYSIAYRMI